ncbi:hypothetical protein RD792_013185 [Penstemon davidsonii]|uniref:Uncharacterized protein n=1 Tax=Penstemon davidsonii TaxID=160366 RepID=A0ABR0CUW7_9LAMI|nr:hypothetical protein RD792_013185 [Penstemon davidsonii]
MESVLISKENVQPSSPTPLHLKSYKISMLDQICPAMVVPVILYFSSPAGRISGDGLSIDCNDQGVPFYVAKVTARLTDLLKNPDQQLPERLIPCAVTNDEKLGMNGSIAMIQVNHFDCGGIAIGTAFRHKIVDGFTMVSFLSAWAATARVSSQPVCPNYISQSLFPQKEEISSQVDFVGSVLKMGKSLMHRFVFDASALGQLKAASNIERPTRVEVVLALIWKCFMVASLSNGKQVSLISQPVNMRRRARPPFPSDCFGNFVGLSAASSTNENKKELGHLVKEIRDDANKIDHDYVNRMLGDEGLLGCLANLQPSVSKILEADDVLLITSWCSLGIYNVDFGWGKPIWMTRCEAGNNSESMPFMNCVWLNDTRFGGVEAWVVLDEKYMEVFENVEELKTYASKDPSPLD